MKHIIILLLIAFCGIPPIPPLPPIGCDEMKPVCVCDSDNNCEWQFMCVPD